MILGSLLIAVTFGPIVKPFVGIMELAFSSEVPDFDREAADIYKEDAIVPETNDVVDMENVILPTEGERFGQLIIESAKVDAPLYYGDGERELLLGVGCYAGTYIPGAGRTVLLAGHNNTIFHSLGESKISDRIFINTNYGKYVYEIVDTKIALENDASAYDLTVDNENLIIYTCYPFDALGLTPERYFVFAKYVSGPQLQLVY